MGGSARCDFPGGSVNDLWESTQKILALPEETRVFVGHDYMPDGREWSVECTVGKERKEKLGTPRLLYAAMQFNIRGGNPPPPEEGSEKPFIKLPLSCDW